jgi:hypothetical protein
MTVKGKGGRPTNRELRYRNTGRPTVMTPEVIGKLEEAFCKGLNDGEACLFAGIKASPFYDYCQANPDFYEKKEALKKNLNIRSKINLHDKIMEGDKDVSKWWLERKAKDEFSTRTESTGKDGESIKVESSVSKESIKTVLDLFKGIDI